MHRPSIAAAVLLIGLLGVPLGSRAGTPVSFELEVQPILAARGCSGGACHGKARGQNGFQLSLLGFDPDFDYAALTREARGRRIFPAAPQRSLLLQKATASVPHGGGQRLTDDTLEYRTLLRWIESGAPRRLGDEPQLRRVSVVPSTLLLEPEQGVAIQVTAHYSDGSQRDVTQMAMFQSNASVIASVDDHGTVQAGPLPGEAVVMARYMNVIATCGVTIPWAGDVPEEFYRALPRSNFIDELVWQKLERLNLTPSEPAGDATFLRRAYVDLIGTVPTADEVRSFLADPSSSKRAQLVDRLLERPEYAEHWANKWADLLRPNPYRVGIKAVLNLDHWIRDSFRKNKPYDAFVRELITARGSTWHNGAVTLFRDRRSPDELGTMVSRLFLGVRLECAKCHHHPFENWGQEDFYSFAAYFARVGRKGTGLSPPISGGEELVLTAARGEVRHPLTGRALDPRPLYGEMPAGRFEDRREALAAWITSAENDHFAKVMVNRVWADLMGRGLVEPVDDLRATNPATNGPLLAALARDFRNQGFDIKHLLRRIATSYVYGLSTLPNNRNAADTWNHSRYYRQRLRAEVLWDAICDITGVPQSYAAMPAGAHAKEIWTHRVSSLFLDTFGRPDPNQDPPCERLEEATVTQALHLMNAPEIQAKMRDPGGLVARWTDSSWSNVEMADELYLTVYARYPDPRERIALATLFDAAPDRRREVVEDVLWAMLNTPEFLFKD